MNGLSWYGKSHRPLLTLLLTLIAVLIVCAWLIFSKNPGWLILLLLGAAFVFLGIRGLRRAAWTKSWTGVEVTILSSDVTSELTGRARKYFPIVQFRYVVNGAAFESNCLSIAFQDYGTYDRQSAEALASTYALGTSADAYYCPDNPALAVLKREVSSERHSQYLAWVCAGALISLFSIVVFFLTHS